MDWPICLQSALSSLGRLGWCWQMGRRAGLALYADTDCAGVINWEARAKQLQEWGIQE